MLRDPHATRIDLTMEQTRELGGGLVRIGVAPETAPHDCGALKQLSGMSSKMAQGLYRAAINKGSRPGNWWGTFERVPREKWPAVETWQHGVWLEFKEQK